LQIRLERERELLVEDIAGLQIWLERWRMLEQWGMLEQWEKIALRGFVIPVF
jgi:hypothetical protein